MPVGKNDDGFTLTLPVKWSILGAAIVVILTGLFYWNTGSFDKTVIFGAAATAAAATVLAAGYTGKTLGLYLQQDKRAQQIHDDKVALRKKHVALRYAERWNDPAMYHVRDVFRDLAAKRNLPQDQLIQAIRTKETNVIHVMNFFEEAAFARKHELADDQVLRNQFEGIVATLWTTMEPWVHEYRKERHRPKIYEMVEELSKVWR